MPRAAGKEGHKREVCALWQQYVAVGHLVSGEKKKIYERI